MTFIGLSKTQYFMGNSQEEARWHLSLCGYQNPISRHLDLILPWAFIASTPSTLVFSFPFISDIRGFLKFSFKFRCIERLLHFVQNLCLFAFPYQSAVLLEALRNFSFYLISVKSKQLQSFKCSLYYVLVNVK